MSVGFRKLALAIAVNAVGISASMLGAGGAPRMLLSEESDKIEPDPADGTLIPIEQQNGNHTGPHNHHHINEERAPFLFFVIVFLMIGSQVLLYWWSRTYKSSFTAVSLLGMWVTPFLFSAKMLYYRFLCIWVGFTICTAYFVNLAQAKDLHVTTPRRVYEWFFRVSKICYFLGVSGYLIILSEVMGISSLLQLPLFLTRGGTLLLFYGLYFGVLGRDAASICADRISTTLGYRKKDDDHCTDAVVLTVCALCGEDLRPNAVGQMMDGGMGDDDDDERLFELGCGHTFHEFCIRGWSIVGKKNTCPHCSERVDLRAIVGKSPWESQSLAWMHLLDALRYLLVWNPLILMGTNLVLHGLGAEEDSSH